MSEQPISCQEALRLLADYVDRELQPEAHESVRHHLEACRACFSRAEFERGLKARLAALRTHEVDDAFERRIVKLLDGFEAIADANGA